MPSSRASPEGIKPGSPALQAYSLLLSHQGRPNPCSQELQIELPPLNASDKHHLGTVLALRKFQDSSCKDPSDRSDHTETVPRDQDQCCPVWHQQAYTKNPDHHPHACWCSWGWGIISRYIKMSQWFLSERKSVLNIHWKDWCWSWSSETLATWCKELTHWKRPWGWERLKMGGEGYDRGWDGWMVSLTQSM